VSALDRLVEMVSFNGSWVDPNPSRVPSPTGSNFTFTREMRNKQLEGHFEKLINEGFGWDESVAAINVYWENRAFEGLSSLQGTRDTSLAEPETVSPPVFSPVPTAPTTEEPISIQPIGEPDHPFTPLPIPIIQPIQISPPVVDSKTISIREPEAQLQTGGLILLGVAALALMRR